MKFDEIFTHQTKICQKVSKFLTVLAENDPKLIFFFRSEGSKIQFSQVLGSKIQLFQVLGLKIPFFVEFLGDKISIFSRF